MAATPIRPFRFTREQYYELDRLGYFLGRRVERIRGEILERSPISWPHVVACRKAGVLLERVFTGVGWVSRNEQLITLADSDPEPDVMVVPGRFEDYSDHPTTALLVVEVSDATLFHDTTTKAEVYAEAGIPEYWVIDLEQTQLLVFRDPAPIAAGGASYRTQLALAPNESVSPLAAPAVSVAVADLLP
jgi:Uma2 family endonuclease